MSKIIMDAHRTNEDKINKTKELVYLKVVDSISYLYMNGKVLNQYVSSNSNIVLTTLTQLERPDLNIKPLEIKIT